ncbi:imidazolonepropionase [Pleionea litopenaei]|uniref:Imidazolonepropionase n=1 Tax=Pleionea litopenaei TaxID=3070815 RepID=A0AA51X7H6_9GAMM|nr:imidazolonepropionase [Pleionea sp. HL-JVS1]WMS88327.1 imidazolonepropionase [Pleionea sp. HL-JVS1]
MSTNSQSIEAILQADSIWFNANIITFANDRPYGTLENAYLAVKQNAIVAIGKLDSETLSCIEQSNAQCTDLQQRWISPGLIDCHTHIVYGGNRSAEFEQRLQGVSYEEIAKRGGGILSTVNATRAATHEELLESAMKRAQDLLDQGVTTFEVKSGYGLDAATEIKMLEVVKQLQHALPATIVPTFLGAHAVPPEYKGKADEYIDYLCDVLLPDIKKRELADTVDAFCETIGFSYEQVEKLFKSAQQLGMKVKLHAEQLSDQQGTQLATRYSALSVDHLEYLSNEGINALSNSETVAVLLPAAFYFLRETKLPPIQALREQQVPIALATDCNPGSSPCTSILLILNMACTLFQMTPEEALRGVTINAAKALGLLDQVGTIEVGKHADFAVWDIQQPADLSYAIGANPCVGVVHQGKLVLDKLF